MPITITRLLAFEGPNIVGPQPGVLLQARSERDRSARLRAALKDSAQGAGIVIGALNVTATPSGAGVLLEASFATPTPALGAAVARYSVDGLNAHAAGDEEWDAEGQLWELQKRRRAEALPVAALQLLAEARARNLPAFMRPGGELQIGYGSRSWSIGLAALRASAQPEERSAIGVGADALVARAGEPAMVPWEQIGAVPILAVTGGAARSATLQQVSAALLAAGRLIVSAANAGFDATRALLADTNAELIVVGLDADDLLRRGLPFDRCAASALVGLPDEAAFDMTDRVELVRALGLPALVTDPGGRVALDAATPAIVALTEYAAAPTVLLELEENPERLGRLAAQALLDALP